MVTRAQANAYYDGDHAYIDGVETVAYLAPDDAGTTVATVKAKRRELTKQEISFAANAGLPVDTIAFTLWDSTLGGNSPERRGLITDAAGDKWSIASVTLQRFGTQWVCLAHRKQ